MGEKPLLEMRGIRKVYPGVRALDGVDFLVRVGEVHALLGENGAGKSTLIKVMTGATRRDGGEILLAGKEIWPGSTKEAQEAGISTVYQEINLVPTLSVAENLFLGREPRRLGMIRWGQVKKRARAALERLNIKIDVNRDLGEYSIAIQQMVAIARAVDIKAKLLILDEPTSSLDAGEVEQLFGLMRKLKGEGLGIVFVTHFLDQVYAVSDRITVLRNGKLVGEYETAKLGRMDLVGKMMGRELAELEYGKSEARVEKKGQALVVARGIAKRGSIEPIALELSAGEVVGLAGLLGSGRTEVAKLLFGIDRADRGEVRVEGKAVKLRGPREAIRLGFAFVPEDRKTQSIIPELTIRENIILAMQASRGWVRAYSRATQEKLAEKYIAALQIATPDGEQAVKNLSGGNQQKVILARWLASQPRVLILDEPTRGIDVGAKAEIQKLVLSLCSEGMAILFISSELEEVVRVSDRVAVLRDRRKVGELSGADVTEQAVMRTIASEGGA
ncbi:MAG TPA: sugar ABC transporter ATP-binding protein [Tepidisphaeraceae bacterium]|jgi:simple sugar transport system ATP-binding protein|nr:sugar ABC transporter ATP-binding protein [Tepidisphaeraceae bacterium]